MNRTNTGSVQASQEGCPYTECTLRDFTCGKKHNVEVGGGIETPCGGVTAKTSQGNVLFRDVEPVTTRELAR